jgi:hypothetical protein
VHWIFRRCPASLDEFRPSRAGRHELGHASRRLGVLLIAAPALVLALSLKAQDTDNLTKDEDYREELGVNDYTAPSIEKLFNSLDSLKPIPVNDVTRPITDLNTADRSKYALSYGVLIGDGFLAVESQQNKDIEALGRELIRRAKILGVEQRVSRHSSKLLELAKHDDWQHLRRELIVTQADVEAALLQIRDEPIVHLLSLGGWIRGLQIEAASVAVKYSPERAKVLRDTDLLDYYLDRLATLPSRLKRSALIQKIIVQLQTIQTLYKDNSVLTVSQVSSLRDSSTAMLDWIEGP